MAILHRFYCSVHDYYKMSMVILFLNSNISCFAEVLVAQVCLERCELAIPEIYKKVPVLAATKLINQTLLPTVFEWGDVSLLTLIFFKEAKSDPHPQEKINSALY